MSTEIATIESKIMTFRGHRVIMSSDLAEVYGVPTKRLNEQAKRNISRFPEDFAFQLSQDEFDSLRSQFATSSHGGVRYLPYAFTEHGAIMAASVLSSERAVEMSIQGVRAFVKMREMLLEVKTLFKRLNEFERHTDSRFNAMFYAIWQLMAPPSTDFKPKIGFQNK